MIKKKKRIMEEEIIEKEERYMRDIKGTIEWKR